MNIKSLFSETVGVNPCNLVKLIFSAIIVILVTGCASSIPKKSSWVGTIGCNKKPVFLQFTGEDDYSGIMFSLEEERSSRGLQRYEFRLPFRKTNVSYDKKAEVLRIGDCEESRLVRMPENWGWGIGDFGELQSIYKRCSVARGWLDKELDRLGIKKPKSPAKFSRYRRNGNKPKQKIDDSLSPDVLAKVMISPGFEKLFGKSYLDLTKEERKWLNYAVVSACSSSDTPLVSVKVQGMFKNDTGPYSRETVLSLHNQRQKAINDFESLIREIERVDPKTVSKSDLTRFADAQLPGKPYFTKEESSKFFSEYREKLSSKISAYYIGKIQAIEKKKPAIEDLRVITMWDKKDKKLWRKLTVADEEKVKSVVDNLVSNKLASLLEKDIQVLKQKVNGARGVSGFIEPYRKLVRKYSALRKYNQYSNAEKIIVELRGGFIKKWAPEVREQVSKMKSISDVDNYMRSIKISLDSRVPEVKLWHSAADKTRNMLQKQERQEKERIARKKREEEAKLFAHVQKLILRSFKVPLTDSYDER